MCGFQEQQFVFPSLFQGLVAPGPWLEAVSHYLLFLESASLSIRIHGIVVKAPQRQRFISRALFLSHLLSCEVICTGSRKLTCLSLVLFFSPAHLICDFNLILSCHFGGFSPSDSHPPRCLLPLPLSWCLIQWFLPLILQSKCIHFLELPWYSTRDSGGLKNRYLFSHNSGG